MPKALVIEKVDGKPGQVYFPLKIIDQAAPQPKANEVVIRVSAAALNHRDLFIRQQLYPAIAFGAPLLADGTGVVVETGSSAAAKQWHGKRVILNPGSGWKDDPEGPEGPHPYVILGGSKLTPIGTAAELICVDAAELEEAPKHLTSAEAAALPLAGLTAWRALVTKSGQAKPGRNVLITGIGGGVAIMALLFAAAAGANVYVTSSSEAKLAKAKELGAKGGVNYKEKDWDKKLLALLPKERKKLDAIIDGAGGDVVGRGAKLLRDGGVISQYGMTVSPKMTWSMPAVLKNIDLKGSTMGSRKEFAELVAFVNKTGIKPLVSRVVSGIDNIPAIDSLFEDMKNGSQLGKLVIEIVPEQSQAKL